MADALKHVKIAPKGMGLNDFVAHQEGFFAAEGLDVELDWKTFRGTQSSWKGLDYFQRPQDRPYTQDKRDVIQGACLWGTICNASAGMGKMVPDAYGVSPWAIFVRPDSKIRRPEDLKDVPVSVGMRAGSHFNVPYRLEKYLPLESIKVVNTGGFGARPQTWSTAMKSVLKTADLGELEARLTGLAADTRPHWGRMSASGMVCHLTDSFHIVLGSRPTNAADVIRGTAAGNTVNGGGGNDRICTLGGNDKAYGGAGKDRLFTGPGNDLADGGPEADLCDGGPGTDRVNTKGGPDTCVAVEVVFGGKCPAP